MNHKSPLNYPGGGFLTVFTSWPSPLKHSGCIGLITALLCGITAIVYLSGGTRHAFPYLMLLPILLAAVSYGIYGGLLTGLLAGLLVGPAMPLHVDAGIAQTAANWSLRLLLYMLVGGAMGTASYLLLRYAQAQASALRSSSEGLLNQTALLEDLKHALAKATKQDRKVAVVMVQITDLMEILASIGADAEDALLRAIGTNLCRQINCISEVYQLGSAELVVLVEYERADILDSVADLITAVGEESVVIHGVPVRAQLVAGISCGAKAEDAQELIRQVRVAAFEALERQQPVCYYASGYERTTAETMLLVAQVRRALAAGEFELYYQPKVCLQKNNAVCGCEALIRWRGEGDEVIPPGLFMPKVERTTLIAPVTRFVTLEASKFIREQGAGPVSVNFTVGNLFDHKLIDWLMQLITDLDLPAGTLEIEVTERALVRDPSAARCTIASLHKAGISVLLDDFGTGYSSFAHLRQLPIAGLKIDQTFVQDLDSDRRAYRLLACMIDMAHALDLPVTAEGVETAEQAQLLREMGCDFAQGYYFARPMPAARYRQWLRDYELSSHRNHSCP